MPSTVFPSRREDNPAHVVGAAGFAANVWALVPPEPFYRELHLIVVTCPSPLNSNLPRSSVLRLSSDMP